MKAITPEHVELIDAVLAEVDIGLLTASTQSSPPHDYSKTQLRHIAIKI